MKWIYSCFCWRASCQCLVEWQHTLHSSVAWASSLAKRLYKYWGVSSSQCCLTCLHSCLEATVEFDHKMCLILLHTVSMILLFGFWKTKQLSRNSATPRTASHLTVLWEMGRGVLCWSSKDIYNRWLQFLAPTETWGLSRTSSLIYNHEHSYCGESPLGVHIFHAWWNARKWGRPYFVVKLAVSNQSNILVPHNHCPITFKEYNLHFN